MADSDVAPCPVDVLPSVCPLCGADNRCAVESGQDASSCWCMSADIAPVALARLPQAARGRACLCPRCAAQIV